MHWQHHTTEWHGPGWGETIAVKLLSLSPFNRHTNQVRQHNGSSTWLPWSVWLCNEHIESCIVQPQTIENCNKLYQMMLCLTQRWQWIEVLSELRLSQNLFIYSQSWFCINDDNILLKHWHFIKQRQCISAVNQEKRGLAADACKLNDAWKALWWH